MQCSFLSLTAKSDSAVRYVVSPKRTDPIARIMLIVLSIWFSDKGVHWYPSKLLKIMLINSFERFTWPSFRMAIFPSGHFLA